MENLNLIVKNDVVYADSREVAEIVDKRHADLCRDIAKYIAVLTERNFAFSDFFVESSYIDKVCSKWAYLFVIKKLIMILDFLCSII